MAKKVGLILSGCGHLDGSEIHEATLTLLHLAKAGVEVVAMAPNIEHSHVIDHFSGEPYEGDHASVLSMAARLMRGDIKDIADVKADELDALIIPGGYGAAKNLSNYAYAETAADVVVEIHTHGLVNDMFNTDKPMGFICIAPAAVAAVALKDKGLNLTCGNDPKAALTCIRCGHEHIDGAKAHETLVDKDHKIVCTPAYMASEDLAEIEKGIANLVREVLAMVKEEAPEEVEKNAKDAPNLMAIQ